MHRFWWPGPTVVAVLVTLLTAARPAVVDDTAYLTFARHIASDPADPYGFELFWYRQPDPAMRILLPPVVPYWLALGITIFGENLILLKCWMFPFVLIFCHAASALLRRFARGVERPGLVLLAGSPFVLPLMTFMLDVPAVGLGLAAVAVFVRGCDRGSWRLALAAGVLAALAAQTKYTMIVLPAVLAWYGLLHRRLQFVIAAGVTAVGVFAAWELYLAAQYGTSHFWFHVRDQQTAGGIKVWVSQKSVLVRPLLSFLGGLAAVWGLLAGRVVGWSRWVVGGVGVAAAVGFATVCVYPIPEATFQPFAERPRSVDLPALVYYPPGAFVVAATLTAAAALAFRTGFGPAGRLRRDPAAWFLVGWLVIEVAGYFVFTPFPAARRVVAVSVVIALLTCRLWSLVQRFHPGRSPGRWVFAFGLACGFGLLALDWWDSLAEKELVAQSAEVIRGEGRVWTQGHWGWQYYAERRGWKLIEPGRSRLKPGDWLVVPGSTDPHVFARPDHGTATFAIPPDAVELVRELAWIDRLPARTIPNLYGGSVPVIGRDGPRLTVKVFRVRRDWIPQPNIPD